MPNHFQSFSNHLTSPAHKRGIAEVFNDLVTMGVCSYHRTNIQSRLQEKDETNERLYLNVADKYSREELKDFAKAIGTLSLSACEAPYSDILGQYFTENVTNGHNGQFFTPDSVSELMSGLCSSGETTEHKTVFDPACGSGRLLLNFAKKHPNNLFFGADSNETCAKMSALNFFLNGLRGEVAWMNALSMQWYGGWHINLNGIGILPIEKEESMIWEEVPERPTPELPIGELNQSDDQPQLTLF